MCACRLANQEGSGGSDLCQDGEPPTNVAISKGKNITVVGCTFNHLGGQARRHILVASLRSTILQCVQVSTLWVLTAARRQEILTEP